MACSTHLCLLLAACLGLSLSASAAAQSQKQASPASITQNNLQDQKPAAEVMLRWGVRPGVFRYRLQLAADSNFADIVFDGVVSGHEYRIRELTPGTYFWRIAPLTSKLGDFSSAGVIEIPKESSASSIRNAANPDSISKNGSSSSITTVTGWYAAVGNVPRPILARVRSAKTLDIVGVSTDGRVIALDAATGIALWTARPQSPVRPASGGAVNSTLAVRAQTNLDNILVLSANLATMLDSRGRELWRLTLPAFPSSAVTDSGKIFVIDNSLQRLFIVNGSDGKLLAQAHLTRRAVGPPAFVDYQGARRAMIALDDGRVQILDQTGKVIHSGDVGSPATTPPLPVRSARSALVLVGSRNGLTALNGGDLRPLGRVTLKDDTPRGLLLAEDLDGDGVAEVVMFTERGRIVVVKSDDGKLLWEGDARHAEAATVADLNGDRIYDLLMAGRDGLAFALSGRDGAMIWKEENAAGVAANHAASLALRSTLVAPSGAGVLLIAGDPFRGGLRAIQFPRGSAPASH
jgi:outer membrane protein assembly factor BamB